MTRLTKPATDKFLRAVEASKKSYAAYLHLVWPALSGGKAPLTPYELDAFCWASEQSPGRSNQRYLGAHREFGKSTGETYALPGFMWLRDPTLTGSAHTKSGPKATEALTAVRELLNRCSILKHLVPPEGSFNKDHSLAFHVAGAVNPAVPSFKALGSTSQSTGGRNDFVIFDDFETLENSVTREARQATAARMREIVRTAREGALIICVGTYARDESCYQDLIDQGWEHRIYPILYPTQEEIELATNKKTGVCYYAPILLKWLKDGFDYAGRPTAPGQIVQPERFSPEYVARNMAGGLGEFRRHYMGIRKSALADEYALRLSDLMVMDCKGPAAPMIVQWGVEAAGRPTTLEIEVDTPGNTDCFRRPAYTDAHYAPFHPLTVMHIDTAGFGKDMMAWSTWSKLAGNYFNRALRGTRLRAEDQDGEGRRTLSDATAGAKDSILSDIVKFGVSLVQVESQFGGIHLAERLRSLIAERGIPCTVTCEPAKGQKEQRILSQARTPVSLHRVIVDEAVAANTDWQHQYTRLTASPGCLDNDDLIEAWAAGLALVSAGDLEITATTQQVITLESEQDDLNDELGITTQPPRWGQRSST